MAGIQWERSAGAGAMTHDDRVSYTFNISPEAQERFAERIAEFNRNLATASGQAADALRSLGVRFSGLSTVELMIPGRRPIVNQRSEHESQAHAQPTACARCLNYSNNPYLACAVHPLGRPGEVCADWEDGEANGHWTTQNQREHEANYDRYIVALPTDLPRLRRVNDGEPIGH